jgi:hypothetical membrane protein
MVEVTDTKGGDDEITFDWEAGRLLFYPSVVLAVAFAVGAFVVERDPWFEGLSALIFLQFAWQLLIMGGRIKARSTTSKVVMVALGMGWLALALAHWL